MPWIEINAFLNAFNKISSYWRAVWTSLQFICMSIMSLNQSIDQSILFFFYFLYEQNPFTMISDSRTDLRKPSDCVPDFWREYGITRRSGKEWLKRLTLGCRRWISVLSYLTKPYTLLGNCTETIIHWGGSKENQYYCEVPPSICPMYLILILPRITETTIFLAGKNVPSSTAFKQKTSDGIPAGNSSHSVP